jgi:hypothetical protein
MATVYETVTFTISGPNSSQTKSVQVAVDEATGVGSATFQYTGSVAGTDKITAGMDSVNGTDYASNLAEVDWQATNGAIACAGMTATVYSGGKIYTGDLATKQEGPYSGNSIVFNQRTNGSPISGFVSSDGNSGAYKLVPPVWLQQNASGVWTSNITFTTVNSGNNESQNTLIQGYIVVPKAGTYTFIVEADDSWICWMYKSLGGAIPVRQSGSYQQPLGASATPQHAGAIFMGCRLTAAIPFQNEECFAVNFPQPGVYPIECGWGDTSSQEYFQLTWTTQAIDTFTLISNSGGTYGYGIPYSGGDQDNGSDILPVSSLFTTAPPTSVSGVNLALTPSGGATNLLIQGQSITLTLAITGIKYQTKPYIPVLEGIPGEVFIYNNSTAFVLPGFPQNGNSPPTVEAPDLTTVAAQAFTLAGADNNSWQGRFGVVPIGSPPTGIGLSFNGSGAPSGVVSTQLEITFDDVAWCDATGTKLDLYSSTSQGGGKTTAIQVNYLVSPVVAALSQTSIAADGASHTLTFTLVKPLPPLQSGTTFTVSFSGGSAIPSSVGNVTLITDATTGFVTGFSVPIVSPALTNNGTGRVWIGATASALTYLNGSTFTTGAVTYLYGTQSIDIGAGGVLTYYLGPHFTAANGFAVGTKITLLDGAGAGVYTISNVNSANEITVTPAPAGVGGASTYVIGAQVPLNITWTKSAYPPPTFYAWAGPTTTTAVSTATSTALQITATVYSRANNISTCQFYKVNNKSQVRTAIGSLISPTNPRTLTIGGSLAYLADFVLNTTFASLDTYLVITDSGTTNDGGDTLGFISKDTDGQTCTYWDTAIYGINYIDATVGTGGCPAVEMFIDETHQVCDAVVGTGLECLPGNGDCTLLLGLPRPEVGQVQTVDFSTEVCHHLVAENGAEVIVSCSTPVPTLESICTYAEDASQDILTFASDIVAGMHVITDVGNGPEWSVLTEATCVGTRRVARLYCGGRNFAAGVRPGKYIYTHNLLVVTK